MVGGTSPDSILSNAAEFSPRGPKRGPIVRIPRRGRVQAPQRQQLASPHRWREVDGGPPPSWAVAIPNQVFLCTCA